MIVATIKKLSCPEGATQVMTECELLDEAQDTTNSLAIPAELVKALASMDRAPRVGDRFMIGFYRIT